MDWIEISANNLEKAKIDASVSLGVAVGDIEVVVLENREGLLNRILHHGVRIRARIKPLEAAPTRRKSRGTKRSLPDKTTKESNGRESTRRSPKQDTSTKAKEPAGENKSKNKSRNANYKERSSPQRKAGNSTTNVKAIVKENTKKEDIMNSNTNENQTPENNIAETKEQAEQISNFLFGLCNVMGLNAHSRITTEGEMYAVELLGDNLGVLIGRHGVVFNAIQDISRTVARTKSNQPPTDVTVDIANYRNRRTTALTEFVTKQAQRVLETQKQVVLERMDSAERKIVHEVIKGIEGVSTRSEGVEPNRVVIIVVDNTGNDNHEGSGGDPHGDNYRDAGDKIDNSNIESSDTTS